MNTMMKRLRFATGNQEKLKEVREILGCEIEQVDIDLDEIQAIDIKKVIEHKAKEAYKQLEIPVLVEDTALEFVSMKGLPGALIKWFLKTVGNEGLCKMLTAYSDDRRAHAITCVGIYNGMNLMLAEGIIDGMISQTPTGNKGFGWDSIFIPDGYDKTFAEMDSQEKNKISMGKLALEGLKVDMEETRNG